MISIKDLKTKITRKLIRSVIWLIFFNLIIFGLYYYFYQSKSKEIAKNDTYRVVSIYANEIESTIKSLISQTGFYNSLNSSYGMFNQLSANKKLKIARSFSSQLFNRNYKSIIGYEIKNINDQILYDRGTKTNYYISYSLCYRDSIFSNDSNAKCLGNIKLFIDINNLAKYLQSKNIFISSKKSGSSLQESILKATTMKIKDINLGDEYLKSRNNPLSTVIILTFLLNITINILFFWFIYRQSNRYYNYYYVDQILILYDSINKDKQLNTEDFITTELKELVNVINEAKMKDKLDVLSQVQHDLKPAFTQLQHLANNLKPVHKTELISICSNISLSLAGINKNNSRIESVSQVIKQTVNSTFYSYKDIITLDLDRSCFTRIMKSDLYRIISNIITNAIEVNNSKNDLKIFIKTKQLSSHNIISIKDNGVGLPQERIDTIFDNGVSYNSGSGTGLFFCKKKLTNLGGNIVCKCKNGVTEFKISLPLSNASSKYLDKIFYNSNTNFIVIDDENPDYLSNTILKNKNYTHLKSSLEIEKYFDSVCDKSNDIYLVDYHFSETFDGIDIIQKYRLIGKAYIVSTAGNMLHEYNHIHNYEIPILDKSIINYVAFIDVNKIITDYLVVEDSQAVVRMLYKYAKDNSVNVFILNNFLQLNMLLNFISKSSKITLDVKIGDSSFNGLDYAKILYSQGYKNIAIQTGYELIDTEYIKIIQKGTFLI